MAQHVTAEEEIYWQAVLFPPVEFHKIDTVQYDAQHTS